MRKLLFGGNGSEVVVYRSYESINLGDFTFLVGWNQIYNRIDSA